MTQSSHAQKKAVQCSPQIQRAGGNPLAVEKEEVDKGRGIDKAVRAVQAKMRFKRSKAGSTNTII